MSFSSMRLARGALGSQVAHETIHPAAELHTLQVTERSCLYPRNVSSTHPITGITKNISTDLEKAP